MSTTSRLMLLTGLLAIFLTACGSETHEISSVGRMVEARLAQGKADFESKNFGELLQGSGINPNLQRQLAAFVEPVQSASRYVDPALAREGIERSELALACLAAAIGNEQEFERLKANFGGLVDDHRARIQLLVQINELRHRVQDAAFYREACQ